MAAETVRLRERDGRLRATRTPNGTLFSNGQMFSTSRGAAEPKTPAGARWHFGRGGRAVGMRWVKVRAAAGTGRAVHADDLLGDRREELRAASRGLAATKSLLRNG